MKILKWLFRILGVVVLGIAGLLTYVVVALPNVGPAEDVKVESTPERLKRGEYLVHHVAYCLDCHSQRSMGEYGGPVVPGTEGQGGDTIFDERIGLPGTVHPKNITPYNLGKWTDGEIIRALRTGVSKNGDPLFPLMPYQRFAKVSKEDLYSIVAYVRTLKPIAKDVEPHKLKFPVNIIVHTIPKKAPAYPPDVDRKNTVAYGEYLANMANCMECHTPVNAHHDPLPGMDLAGGQEFPILDADNKPTGAIVRTPNLTPDEETGLGKWTKEQFLARFHTYDPAKFKPFKVTPGEMNTIMPVAMLAGMTNEDLGALYDYLHQVKAVKNTVVKYSPPPAGKL